MTRVHACNDHVRRPYGRLSARKPSLSSAAVGFTGRGTWGRQSSRTVSARSVPKAAENGRHEPTLSVTGRQGFFAVYEGLRGLTEVDGLVLTRSHCA